MTQKGYLKAMYCRTEHHIGRDIYLEKNKTGEKVVKEQGEIQDRDYQRPELCLSQARVEENFKKVKQHSRMQ